MTSPHAVRLLTNKAICEVVIGQFCTEEKLEEYFVESLVGDCAVIPTKW